MSRYLQYQIAFLLIIFLLTSPCVSDNTAIYCHGELDYDYHLVWREFVVPERGTYQIYSNLSEIPDLPPAEIDVLRWLLSKYSMPSLDPPFVQISQQKDDMGRKNVRAICVTASEGQPVIPYYGMLEFDDDFFDKLSRLPQLHHLELFSFKVDNGIFPKLSELQNIKYLGLPCKTKDEHLKHIISLSKLKFVNASGTQIKGKGLPFLAKLPRLRILDLRRTQLDAGALTGLQSCESLETLLLSDTTVRDDDLKDLTTLEMLKYITLHKTGITDNGLRNLAKVKNLMYITLYDTPSTKSGHEMLRKSHPGINIDLMHPQHLKEFLTDRLYVAAYLGDLHAQSELVSRYSQARSDLWIHGKERKKLESIYTKEPYELVLYDPVESLKWDIILLARKDVESWIRVDGDTINREIKNLEAQMDSFQISEARRRAKAYLYLLQRSSFKFEIERKEGLPLYQYKFEPIESK